MDLSVTTLDLNAHPDVGSGGTAAILRDDDDGILVSLEDFLLPLVLVEQVSYLLVSGSR